MCGMDYNIGDVEDLLKKKKKKKKKSPGKKVGGVGLAIAAGVVGGLLSRTLKFAVIKYAPVEDPNVKRGIANGLSITIGGGTAVMATDKMIKDAGIGMAADGIIDVGVQVYELATSKTGASVSQYKSDDSETPNLSGTEDYEEYGDPYENINGHEEDYIEGHEDEELVRVNVDGLGETETLNLNKDHF